MLAALQDRETGRRRGGGKGGGGGGRGVGGGGGGLAVGGSPIGRTLPPQRTPHYQVSIDRRLRLPMTLPFDSSGIQSEPDLVPRLSQTGSAVLDRHSLPPSLPLRSNPLFFLLFLQVEAAIYKLHTRRCCTLEFHPGRDSIVVSGDKKGGIAVWDFDKVSGSHAEAAGGSTAAEPL